MVSPFQAWLVGEIMSNAASSINVLTERDQVMPPSSGFHLSLFGNYTLDGIKAVLAISINSVNGAQCAGWNSHTATALSGPAFSPFTWPMLRDTSASYTDIKVYNGNEILFHWILRGCRSDRDLTVQQSFVAEFELRTCSRCVQEHRMMRSAMMRTGASSASEMQTTALISSALAHLCQGLGSPSPTSAGQL